MTTEITYIAYDGTRFDDEDECRNYEMKTKWQPLSGMIKFFNKNGKPLPIDETSFDSGAVHYIICKNKEAAQFLYEELKTYILPWEDYKEADAGCWYWDYGRDTWLSAQDLFDKVDFIKNLIKDEPI